MSVYVDTMRAKFGRMVMCHMVADTSHELLSMAGALGIRLEWIQSGGTPREHFDVSLSKRSAAIKLGAIITPREVLEIIRGKASRAGA